VSEETWQQKYEREEREHQVKAKKAWETVYKKRKPTSTDKWDTYKEYVFDEGTVTTGSAVVVKTTRFRFMKDGNVYMSKLQNKRQLFLVVNGPLKGQRITDENEEYVLFNRNSAWRGGGKGEIPKCVLVHRSAFEA
jgi:hypothetical protein